MESDPLEKKLLDLFRSPAAGAEDQDLIADFDALLTGVPLYPEIRLVKLGNAAVLRLEKTPEFAVRTVLRLLSASEAAARALVCVIISGIARFQPRIWADVVKHLLTDRNWEVRNYAARVFDSRPGFFEGAAVYHFDYVIEVLEGWVRDENYLVRRAPTHALEGYLSEHPEQAERITALLDPLLDDEFEYVRSNHVMALRDIGRLRPEWVMEYIESRLPNLTDRSRETFRQVLNHRFAEQLPDRRSRLLAAIG